MTKSSHLTLKAKQVMGPPITRGARDLTTPDGAWVQVQQQALRNIQELFELKGGANAGRLMLLLLEYMAPGQGGVVVMSRQVMAELLDVSMPTVDRAIRMLVEGNFAQRIKIGGVSALAVNNTVAWVGSRDKLTHAVFSAVVVASSSEQDASDMEPRQLKNMPSRAIGEKVYVTGESTPPHQESLLEVQPPVPVAGSKLPPDMLTRRELEARGQLRIDADTGEILE